MCRGIDHGGRRCPGDTSAARQARRLNAKAKSKHVPIFESHATKNSTETSVTVADEQVIAELELETKKYNSVMLRADADELKTLTESYHNIRGEEQLEASRRIDELVNKIGREVEFLAEQKYGAPSDETLLELEEQSSAEYERKIAEINAKSEELYSKYNELSIREFDLKKEYVEQNPELFPVDERNTISSYLSSETVDWPVPIKKLGEEAEKYRVQRNENWKKLEELISGKEKNYYNTPLGEGLRKRNMAYKQALEELGVEFANSNDVEFSTNSASRAVKSLREAVNFYPKVWVENSNVTAEKFRIKNTSARAHYSGSRNQKSYKLTTAMQVYTMYSDDWTPGDQYEACPTYVKINEDGSYMNPDTGRMEKIESMSFFFPNDNNWVKFDVSYSCYPHKGYKRNFEVEEGVYGSYYKYRKSRKLVGSERQAELTVSPDPKSFYTSKEAGYRVALHEFAHRCEDTTRGIKIMENSFLKRRYKYGTDEAETLKTLPNYNSSEKGFVDNFVSPYMGKVYSDGSREILSMGMESIFAGSYGGLYGGSGHKVDKDYKRAILGMLGSSVSHKK